jgi:hypothetical protein
MSMEIMQGFIAGALTVCGVWIFIRLARKLWIKDAIDEIKKDEKKGGLENV